MKNTGKAIEIMHTLATAWGDEVTIPQTLSEDRDYFSEPSDAAREYYEEFGYVVFRGLVGRERCEAAKSFWRDQVKPFPGHIYRQTTARLERHELNEYGQIMNPVLNVQDLPPQDFSDFRNAALDVLCDDAVDGVLQSLFSEPGKLVQSMYFEGNSATWAHQDSYYLDSARIGALVGGWFALEDIDAGAGRFFVCPGSHKIDIEKNGGDFDIAFHHDRYQHLVVDIIRNQNLEIRAPALQEGDVLFWNSMTIHGSLPSTDSSRTRQSLTAHYIPRSHEFMQFQTKIKALRLRPYNGMEVHHPKVQDVPFNRMAFLAEASAPRLFNLVKRTAVKIVTG